MPSASEGIVSSSVLLKVPRSIHDVDNGKILGFGEGLAEDHPVSAAVYALRERDGVTQSA
jgi:hypothetical protein